MSATINRRHFLTPVTSLQPSGDGYWLHVNRKAMACLFEITMPAWEKQCVSTAGEALNEIDTIEQQLTIFKDSSEVSGVNRNAAANPVRVEHSLFELLQLSKKLNHETGGAFDITSAPLSRCWGFFRREGRIPNAEELKAALAVVGSERVILDSDSRTIAFSIPGVEINFGSIGKGYALDRVVSWLSGRVSSALLSAGSSSIYALGNGDIGDDGWCVGIRHPRSKERRLASLTIRNCAMSTSGSDEQYFEYEGQRYGHIIDPRSSQPAQLISGVTVVAQSAAVADALATAFYVGGPELATNYCAGHPNVLAIMLVSGADRPLVIGSNTGCDVSILT